MLQILQRYTIILLHSNKVVAISQLIVGILLPTWILLLVTVTILQVNMGTSLIKFNVVNEVGGGAGVPLVNIRLYLLLARYFGLVVVLVLIFFLVFLFFLDHRGLPTP